MLFGTRAVLVDSGSLTAQSIRAAVAHLGHEEGKPMTPKLASMGIVIYLKSLMSGFAQYGVPILANDRYPVRKLNIYDKYKWARFERYNKVHFDAAAGLTEVPEGEEKSLHQQFREVLSALVNVLPVIQCYAPGEEGDDVMATALAQIGRISGTKMSLFTRDTDMFQLWGQPRLLHLLYRTPASKTIAVTPQMIAEKYPTQRPDQIPLYKAFLGDAGDSIPKVGGRVFEKEIVANLIAHRKTVQEIYDDYWNETIVYTKGWRDAWFDPISEWLGDQSDEKAPRGQAFINEDLARLKTDCNIVYTYTGGDWSAFDELLRQHSSIAGEHIDGLEYWNWFVGGAHKMIPVFQQDQLNLSDPTVINRI